MRIAVEIKYDGETKQWCVGMIAPPWIASVGRTQKEAKQMFLEAMRAYFEAPRKVKVEATGSRRSRIERVTVA